MTLTMQEKREEFLRRLGYVPIMGGATDGDSDGEGDDDGDELETKPTKKDAYTSAEFEAALRDRLRRQRDSIEKKFDEKLNTKLAEMKAENDKDLKAQLDLANQKLEKFDGLVAIVDKYTELADEQYEAEFNALPDAIKAMAPDEDADPFTKQTWLSGALKAAKLIKVEESNGDNPEKDKTDPKKSKPGFNPKDPKQTKGQKEKLDHIMARFRQTSHFDTM